MLLYILITQITIGEYYVIAYNTQIDEIRIVYEISQFFERKSTRTRPKSGLNIVRASLKTKLVYSPVKARTNIRKMSLYEAHMHGLLDLLTSHAPPYLCTCQGEFCKKKFVFQFGFLTGSVCLFFFPVNRVKNRFQTNGWILISSVISNSVPVFSIWLSINQIVLCTLIGTILGADGLLITGLTGCQVQKYTFQEPKICAGIRQIGGRL